MSTMQSDASRDAADVPPSSTARRVVIAGGGIAGLATAWYLHREAARLGLAVRCTVLEEAAAWGGKVRTERRADFGEPPFILEAGPDGFLTRKPWALALARELGLERLLLPINRAQGRTFALHHGRLAPLPEGLQLLAPTRFWPFVRSPLFSPWAKLRMGLDLVLPPRRGGGDESLADFVLRRFGAPALDTLAEPLMAGVYNAVPAEQSLLATFPQYAEWERQSGSVIRGLRAAERQRPRSGVADADATAPLLSFDDGMRVLIETLVAHLPGDLRLGCAATAIARDDVGTGYVVALGDGSRLSADVVVLATPARVSASLLRAVAPEASARLGTMRTSSIGALYLGLRRSDVPHPLNGFGVVIPSSEGRRIDGMTWSSSKWAHRAPADHVLLRVFFGGPHTHDMMERDDGELLRIVRAELAGLLGVRAAPLFHQIYRWPDAYPQYDVGHLERVAAIESALPAGIAVTGSPYRGIGIPDCVRQGQETAQRVIAALTGEAGSLTNMTEDVM